MARYIQVRMTETSTYSKKFTEEEFAELLGDPVEDIPAIIRNEDNRDSDYGIEGASDLLDDILQPANFEAVTDRDWEIYYDEKDD
jgi:hypothetical protein